MDSLSVALAISRGRRLYHGQPFVVFALDLRDPLGACLAEILHRIGDLRRIDDLLLRAEQRERAPVVVAPSSVEHLKLVLRYLDERPELSAREGCTAGDLRAVHAFAHGARAARDGVPVFLAAGDERGVLRFPLHRGASSDVLPVSPELFARLADSKAANTNRGEHPSPGGEDGEDGDRSTPP